MTIRTVTHWRGGSFDEIAPIGRKVKEIWGKYGGDMHVGRTHFGPEAGQWVVTITFKDWTAYGTAQQGIAADAEYNALFGKMVSLSEMTGRRLVTSVDL